MMAMVSLESLGAFDFEQSANGFWCREGGSLQYYSDPQLCEDTVYIDNL